MNKTSRYKVTTGSALRPFSWPPAAVRVRRLAGGLPCTPREPAAGAVAAGSAPPRPAGPAEPRTTPAAAPAGWQWGGAGAFGRDCPSLRQRRPAEGRQRGQRSWEDSAAEDRSLPAVVRGPPALQANCTPLAGRPRQLCLRAERELGAPLDASEEGLGPGAGGRHTGREEGHPYVCGRRPVRGRLRECGGGKRESEASASADWGDGVGEVRGLSAFHCVWDRPRDPQGRTPPDLGTRPFVVARVEVGAVCGFRVR